MAPKRKTKQKPISDQIREAIDGCEMSRYEIAKRTGVSQSTLSRFMDGSRGIGLAGLDKVAACIGQRVTVRSEDNSNG